MYRADQNRDHGYGCKSLSRDKGVYAQCHLNKDRSNGVDGHISCGVSDGIFALTKGEEPQFILKQQDHYQ